MSAEAPFNAEIATKKWKKKLADDSPINLFLFTQDILKIHRGDNWQSPGELSLKSADSFTVDLRFVHPTGDRRFEMIVVEVKYDDSTKEILHLRHHITPKGRQRFSTAARIPSQYFRIAGGSRLISEYLVNIYPSVDDNLDIASRIWDAHLHTLEASKPEHFRLLKVTLPSNAQN